MSKAIQVKEAVKETLVGVEEPVQVSAQSKARFSQNAVKDPQSGELVMGPDEFINAVAPANEDYVSLFLSFVLFFFFFLSYGCFRCGSITPIPKLSPFATRGL